MPIWRFAGGFAPNQSPLGLAYQSGIVKKVLNPMSAGLSDEQGRATYYREATNGSLDVPAMREWQKGVMGEALMKALEPEPKLF